MEIKYAAVFGDQSLFYDAQSDCEMVGNGHHKIENGIVKVWNFTEKQWADNYKQQVTIDAMRRIIRTPTWTISDQKAGKLPEVGAELAHKTQGLCEFIGLSVDDKTCWALKLKSGLIYIAAKNWCSPIESPEEKAKRSREEWKNNVIEIHQGKRRKMSTSTFLLDDIYDALLSGKLAAPKVGE